MSYTVKEFNSREALQDYLNGACLGLPLDSIVNGLHGLTFAVTPQGASKVTVTFSDSSGAGLTPRQILDQIVTASTNALAGKVVLRNYGYTNSRNPQLAVIEIGAVVDKAGTANTLLGFATAADTTIAEIETTDIQGSILFNSASSLYVVVTHA